MAIEITITVDDVDEADEILAILNHALETGEIDFPFETREKIVNET